MAPGPSTRIKLFVDVVWRTKRWLAFTTALGVAASLALVGMLPKVYRASTTVLVTRQSIPEEFVRSSVTVGIEERMRNLQTQVVSRSYLEQVGREFGTIPANAPEGAVDAACSELRARISSALDRRDFSWFRITVDDVDPARAAGIANRLAGLFIDQNSRLRAAQAAGTLEVTERWEARYRGALADRDAEFAEFNRRNVDTSPDQLSAAEQLLSAAQARAERLTSDIRSRHDRLAALRAQPKGPAPSDASAAGDAASLGGLERQLSELSARYTEENPVVKRARERIARLRGDPTAAGGDPFAARIASAEGEIKGLESDRAREFAAIETYRARLGEAPRRQQRILDLTRDYDQVKLQFETAVAQHDQARRSDELERSSKGEQFQIQDRACPPPIPFKPAILRIVAAGLGLGLAFGAGAIAVRQLVVQTVWGEDELAALVPDLPVIGVIPSLDVAAGSRLTVFSAILAAVSAVAGRSA